MTTQERASESEGTITTINGRDYFWRIEDASLRIRNSNREELSSTSAEVIVALGGSEPDWLTPVEALTEAFKIADDGPAGVVSAATALAQNPNRRAELARTTTDKPTLVALAAFGVSQAGANPLIDSPTWDLLMKVRDPSIRVHALRNNEVLPPSLWQYPDVETRVRVARNPDCPGKVLAALVTSSDAQETPIRVAVASNPNAPDPLLRALAKDNEAAVRRAVGASPRCPLSSFKSLSRDRFADVRRAVDTNPVIPKWTAARRIWADPTPSVHVALVSRADFSSSMLAWIERYARSDPIAQYRLVCSRISRHPNCSDRLAKRVASAQDRVSSFTSEQLATLEKSRLGQKNRSLPPGVLLRAVLFAFAATLGCCFLVAGIVAQLNSSNQQGVALITSGILISGAVLLVTHALTRKSPFRGLVAPPRAQILVLVLYVLGVALLAIPFHGYFGGNPLIFVVAAVLGARFLRWRMVHQRSHRVIWLSAKLKAIRSRSRGETVVDRATS